VKIKMPNRALPVLLGASIADAAAGVGKKKKRKPNPKVGDSCDVSSDTPSGFRCEGGVLERVSPDESELELEEDLSDEESGDLPERDEDISPSEDEDVSSENESEEWDDGDTTVSEGSPSATCEEFFDAIHVSPSDPDEYAIHHVAVSQSVIPSMDRALKSFAEKKQRPIDADEVGPLMVLESLNTLIPICNWKYDDVSDEFTYDDGKQIESTNGSEVMFSLMRLASEIVDKYNQGYNLEATVDPNQNLTATGSDNFTSEEDPNLQGS